MDGVGTPVLDVSVFLGRFFVILLELDEGGRGGG